MNFVNIKIEPKSPNCQGGGFTQSLDISHHSSNRDLHTGGGGGGGGGVGGGPGGIGSHLQTMDASNTTMMGSQSHYTGSGQIPVGIAVARQRLHPDPGITGATGSTSATIKDLHSSRHIGSTYVEMIPQLGNNIYLSAPSTAPTMIGSWQYPMESMQMPIPPSLQFVREPTTGQYIFVPAMEPYPQAVMWPYANMQPTQPAPIQFLGTSDYLSATASTTLHQHTQHTSTRLVALPSNDIKQRYNTTGANAAPTGNEASSLMSIVNKVPSLNSHLMPSTLNNTIIKIEDNCAISTTGAVQSGGNLLTQDHFHSFTTAPSINTSADLMNASLSSGGFLMPHTPMLTPAPSMFDMNEKPFLANISQQQRQFQFNLNSSVKSEACSMMSGDPSATHGQEYSAFMYPQSHLVPSDFQHQLPPLPPSCMSNVTTLDTSGMGLTSHPTLMLTPPTVIAARSTGGLLTPPSPMPPQKQPTPQQQQQIISVPVSNLLAQSVGDNVCTNSTRMESSLLTVCSMDVLSVSASIGGGGGVDSEARASAVPGVQDATMQTDTPVCSDEENTQDTALSETSAVKDRSQDGFVSEENSAEQVCHSNNNTTSGLLLSKGCQATDFSRPQPVVAVTVQHQPEESDALAIDDMRTEQKPAVARMPVDLSGLELLSNSIEAFETIKREAGPVVSNNSEVLQATAAENEFTDNNPSANENAPNGTAITAPPIATNTGNDSPPTPAQQPQLHHNDQFDGLNLLCALAEQRLVEEEGEEQQQQKDAAERLYPAAPSESSLEVTPKKSNAMESDFENSPVGKLSDLERNIKQRLADLTRQCEEKRRELDKMEKINPFYRMGYAQSYPVAVPNKFAMSDDEETRSSRSASVRTPLTPTLLFGTNSNGQGGNSAFNSVQSDVPKVSSDTESSKYDDIDMGSLEKMSSKRKGVLPKRWDDCSETETIVAKKPKNLVGYIFSAKNRSENENKGVGGGGGKTTALIKHGQLRPHYTPSPSSGSTSSEQQVKFEPMKIKEEILDDEGVMSVAELFKPSSASASKTASEEKKHRKRNKAKKRQHREAEAKRRRSAEVAVNRCKLTDLHLDDKEKKTRVLTSMGGLFYAGVLAPIQPPDIYSVVLDGERGNKPHIMSREEVQRDAVLEIIPTEPVEVPPGTRLCAYWSQQYRCLYPGTAAPGVPDADSKKQYISVEFDDGDSGRIAIGDIRLLFNDYPIVEYDPNPLLSLGKRKGRVGSAMPETGFNALIEPTTSSGVPDLSPSRLDRAAEKERRRMKKMKKHLLKKQQQLPCCQSAATTNDDGTKRKSKCTEELCKHRRHKKKRKHKKHDLEKGEEEGVDPQKSEAVGASEPAEDTTKQYHVVVVDSKQQSGQQQFSAVDNEDTEETMDSYSAADDPDFKDPANKKKDSPEQNKSKIAAFLPARQLWAWAGESYRRSCVKGRVKKQFYKMIQRGKETIEVGDSAVFLSTGRPDRPYIGQISSMWKTNACNMIVRVKWFYHPEETQGCPSLQYPGGLFESPHEDENDVQTISHKCEVLKIYDFIEKLGDDPKNLSMIYDNNDTYYLAGSYDPTMLSLTMQPNIPRGQAAAPPGTT